MDFQSGYVLVIMGGLEYSRSADAGALQNNALKRERNKEWFWQRHGVQHPTPHTLPLWLRWLHSL